MRRKQNKDMKQQTILKIDEKDYAIYEKSKSVTEI